MSINLAISFSHPDAISNFVQYQRIDNGTNTPVTVVPNPIVSPSVIATNIPAGQYLITSVPQYADGRTCQPTTYQTPACLPLNSITAYISSGNIIVSYNAPSTAPKVRITVGFPNGGSNVANYVNTGSNIIIPIPAGLTGDFTVNGQSVCDETSGFYSAPSTTVVVTIGTPVAGTFALGTSSGTICNNTPGTYYTNGAFQVGSTLYTDIGLSNIVTGFNFVAYNNAIYSINTTTGIVGNATGGSCNATITGSNGLSAGIPIGNGNITAPAGAIVHVTVSAGGPSGGTYTTQFYIPSLSIAQSATNGVNTFTFTMPPAGSVAWNATYTSSNTDGSGGVTVY